MTMRTYTKLQCSCGQTGEIVESENDQPFSKEWSKTSLRNLGYKGSYQGSHHLIAKMHPSCLNCGNSLSPEHIVE